MGHSMVLQQMSLYSVSGVSYGVNNNFYFQQIAFQSDYAYASSTSGLNGIFAGLVNTNAWFFGYFINLYFHSFFYQ
jgi:hypothetical protein